MDKYDPSKFSDDDLRDVFEHLDRDRYPERYALVCTEMESRGMSFECLPQSEREARRMQGDGEDAIAIRLLVWMAFLLVSGVGAALFDW